MTTFKTPIVHRRLHAMSAAAAILLGGSMSLAAQTTPPAHDGRAGAATNQRIDSAHFDHDAWRQNMDRSSVDLAEAVRLVEQKCGCKAVEARWAPDAARLGRGMRGDAGTPAASRPSGATSPVYFVLCVDDTGRTQTATVDCATKAVSMGAVDGMASTSPRSIVKSEKVVGTKLYNQTGDAVGKIKDLAIAPESGEIIYAIVSYDAGDRNRVYAVPWGALPAATSHDGRSIDVAKDRLKDAPSFEEGVWPDLRDRSWGDRVDRFYGYSRPDWRGQGNSMALFKAAELIGRDIRNSAGENLGEIEDLAIDPNRGAVQYVVVAHGGFLGINEKLYGVPWRALRHADGYCIVDIGKEELKRAGGFEKDNWPDMTSDSWDRRMRETFPRSGEARPRVPGSPDVPSTPPQNPNR